VKREQASGTAVLIATSLVLMHRHPEYAGLVSAKTADLCASFIEACSQTPRSLLNLVRHRWFQHAVSLIERLTIPGILRHYALRKKCLAQLTREALESDIEQVVVLGAGFDPLALELHDEFPRAHFWEIDHPATQQNKSRAAGGIDMKRFHFVAADLTADQVDTRMLESSGFDSKQRTFWLAEGLLMYFPESVVAHSLGSAASLSARGSRFVFTFMERQHDGRIRFQRQTRLVDWWLRQRGEPFAWGVDRSHMAEFARPWQVVRIFDQADLRALDLSSADLPLAAGELICLAEIS
jgi:methyltransferase (TIGR00027 family)